MTIHPARMMAFDDLLAGLTRAMERGFVYRRYGEELGLHLYSYTSKCVYDIGWDQYSLLARGLIIDEVNKTVVATPFPKFFNLGERQVDVPDLSFEVFEKLDGSLIIVFHHQGRWHATTKGEFHSDQARWAQNQLNARDLSALTPGSTYLFEAIHPCNRIIVRYDEPALSLLAAYAQDGRELSYPEIQIASDVLGWPAAKRYQFASIAALVKHAALLPRSEEGFVIRFSDGLRLKVKGTEYLRIRALIARCTPLDIWEAMNNKSDLSAIRRDLPEEFWSDFDQIAWLTTERIERLKHRIEEMAASVAHLTDKEVGLALETMPEQLRPFLFIYQKTQNFNFDKKTMDKFMRLVRPKENVLPGYMPSFAMRRAADEML